MTESDSGDRPLGRLYSSLESAFDQSSGEPLFQFNLTARGAPISDGIEGIMGFLDLARRWVVKSFVSFTTPEAHRSWRRLQ
jgi:hypothetical protein